MSQLRVFVLGTPRVEQDGAAFEVDTRKATAALAYLAVSGEAQSRDSLGILLWPDYDTSSARGALRRTLSSLRGALAEGTWLRADRDIIDLDRASLWLDAARFRELDLACQSHGHAAAEACGRCLPLLEEAASLYRGDFMAGFSLRDSLEFEDWQSLQAGLYRRQLVSILERLARALASRGQHEPAIQHASRLLSIDPLQESAHRLLMQLFNWTGDRSSALRQYRDCVRILGEELDVSPLDETRELYEAILEERLPPAEQEHTQSPEEKPAEPSRAARTPFAGREAELAALHAAHDAVKTSGRLVVIEGEAGIGKSRLAEEFLAAAGNAGRVILRTRCYEGETALAYAPFVDLLRSAAREERLLSRLGGAPLTEASRLAPELASAAGQQPGPLTSPGALSRFFDGICDVLTAAAHGGVIVIEDVQWADEASLEVLAFWLRRLRGRPALLLLTWRGDEVPAAHRLRHILSEAIQRGNGARILLGRLSEAEVGELVAGSGIDAPVGFESRLYEETEGVPFFVAQYIEAAAQGLLEADGRPWQVPEGGRALLQSRLDAVSAQGLQLLAAAAVIGRSFSFEDVRDTSGRSEDETLATLEELLRTGVIREVQGPEAPSPAFDFSHDKLRALVYEQTTLARRRLLHRRVAETLSRGRSRETMALAAKIASHYRQAGEDAAAAAAFRRAAEHALGLHAHAEALRNYHDALALGAERSSEIYEAIGDLQVLEGNYSAALASLERAAATAEPQRLAGIEQKLGGLHHRLGEWPLARRHFAAAIEELGPGAAGGAKARILADWSLTAHASGESQLAAEMAGQALRLAREADDEKALAQAHNLAGMIAAARGDLESAREHLSHSLAIASSLEDGAARIAALNNLALMARRSGDLANAVGLTQEALRLSSQTGDRHREAALRNNLADLYQAQGQAEAAMEQLKQAVAIFAEIGASAGELQPEIWKLVEW